LNRDDIGVSSQLIALFSTGVTDIWQTVVGHCAGDERAPKSPLLEKPFREQQNQTETVEWRRLTEVVTTKSWPGPARNALDQFDNPGKKAS
jgi:hypothetical protein